MMHQTARFSLSAALLAAVACAGPALAADPGQQADQVAGQSAAQTIYLDPDTGAIATAPSETAQSRAKKNAAPADNKAWKTKDGVQMLATDPDNAPAESVVRCPDGSLRMGQVRGDDNASGDRKTLCAASDQHSPSN